LQGRATGDKNNKNRRALEKKHVCKFADGAYELYDFESDLTVVEKPMLTESPSTEALIQTRREDKFFAGRAFGCARRAFRAPDDGIFSEGPSLMTMGMVGFMVNIVAYLMARLVMKKKRTGTGRGGGGRRRCGGRRRG
jgi:hypothetical protein